jgi:hypothetical protein
MSDQRDHDVLENAKAVLASGRPALSPEVRARMWRNVVAQAAPAQAKPFFAWIPWALAAAGTAAIGYLAFQPAVQEDRRSTQVAEVAPAVKTEPARAVSTAEGRAFEDSAALQETPFVKVEPEVHIETAKTAPSRALDKRGTMKHVALKAPQNQELAPEEPPQETIAPQPEEEEEEPGGIRAPVIADRDAEMGAADALRHAGQLARAAAAYEALANNPDAESYAEEALYRASRLHLELGNHARSQALIDAARARFPRGALTPERDALEASIPK